MTDATVSDRIAEYRPELSLPGESQRSQCEKSLVGKSVSSCCSFASYHLIIDARGLRIEIRTPPGARDALATVFGTIG